MGGAENKNSCSRPVPFLQVLECFFHINTVRAKIKKKTIYREVLSVSEQALMALESSGSKQEWGIQPGCAFFPDFAQNGCIFSTVSWIDPSGFAPASPCWRMEIPPPVLRQAASVFP